VEFSFDSPRSDAGQTTQQSLASDKLRKAIERNRAKQAKRAGNSSSGLPRQEAKVVNDGWNLPNSETSRSSRASSSTASRRKVAKVGEVEFTQPIRTKRKSPSTVSYGTGKALTRSSARPKARTKKAKAREKSDLVIKGIWVFCSFLMLRLIFSEGGVMDYYSRKQVMNEKVKQYQLIEEENKGLLREIDLLRKNPRYQRKMVREHLGYIAKDEYLILFAADSTYQQI
tara:strand:+ start:1817 stop:2500 length:684 start_codon:yes stop_codon:yes gene_type:complete